MKDSRTPFILCLMMCLLLLLNCSPSNPDEDTYDYSGLGVNITAPLEDQCFPPGTETTFTVEVSGIDISSVDLHWYLDGTTELTHSDSFEYTLGEEGTFAFSVKVLLQGDSGGTGISDTLMVEVSSDCVDPLVAVIDTPANGSSYEVDEEITFAASVSGGTPPYAYLWEFSENSGLLDSNEESPTVSFATADDYGATLTVTDSDDATDEATVTFSIDDVTEITGVDSPISYHYTIIATPPNFGGSNTPDGGVIALSYAGAAIFDPITGGFGDVILPETVFAVGTIATPVGGPHAIITGDFSRLLINYYDEDAGEFGDGDWIGIDTGKNIQMSNNDPNSNSFLLTHGSGFLFYDFDTDTQKFEQSRIIPFGDFPGMYGTPSSGIARVDGGGFLVATESTMAAGELWYHEGVIFNDATFIGNIGIGAWEIQIEGEICVVPNRLDDTCSVITWDLADNINIVGTFATGDGPRGCDLRVLPDGAIGCAVANWDDDTITVVKIGLDGAILSESSIALPAGAREPADVVWLDNGSTDFLVSARKLDGLGDIVFVIPSGF